MTQGMSAWVVVNGRDERQLRKQPDAIVVRIDAVRFAGLDEGVQVGAGLRAGIALLRMLGATPSEYENTSR